MSEDNLDMIIPLHVAYFNNLAAQTGETRDGLMDVKKIPGETLSSVALATRAKVKKLYTRTALAITAWGDKDRVLKAKAHVRDEVSLRVLNTLYPTHIRLYGEEMVKKAMPGAMQAPAYKALCQKHKAHHALKLLDQKGIEILTLKLT